jgi:zinc transporter 1/2/3
MNCPDRRNDDEEFDHPEWNQNPPRFAADLTTCEDMNGIANARELGDADRLCPGFRDLRHCELEDSGIKEIGKERLAVGMGVKGSPGTLDVAHAGWHAILTCPGPCTQPIAHVSNEEGHRAGLKSWATWLLSVLVTSTLISLINRKMFSDQSTYSKSNSVITVANACHRSSKLTSDSYSCCPPPL